MLLHDMLFCARGTGILQKKHQKGNRVPIHDNNNCLMVPHVNLYQYPSYVVSMVMLATAETCCADGQGGYCSTKCS